jgi:lysine 2,3-aminomutase
MLKKYRPIWLNTQFNHPREITADSRRACDQILTAGIPVNNQSVLLKGVNDDVQTMTDLCRKLLTTGVRPYYLYQCDVVKGTLHFRTPVKKGLEIIRAMRGRVSGMAIPKFVIDLPEGGGKIPLEPRYLMKRSKSRILFKNFEDKSIEYPDID